MNSPSQIISYKSNKVQQLEQQQQQMQTQTQTIITIPIIKTGRQLHHYHNVFPSKNTPLPTSQNHIDKTQINVQRQQINQVSHKSEQTKISKIEKQPHSMHIQKQHSECCAKIHPKIDFEDAARQKIDKNLHQFLSLNEDKLNAPHETSAFSQESMFLPSNVPPSLILFTESDSDPMLDESAILTSPHLTAAKLDSEEKVSAFSIFSQSFFMRQ